MQGFTVSCIITGEEQYLNKNTLQNKLKKFGSTDNLQRYFVSRDAAKLLKSGLTIQQVREKLKSKLSNQVDMEILYKLNLMKITKKRKKFLSPEQIKQQQEQTQENERKYYEHKEKMSTCLKTWVEWATGGPNQCQVPQGGTCIRPDIYYDNEGSREGRCKPCPYHQYCLCTNKEIK